MRPFPSRITIFGTPGSGKTTLAKKMGQALGLPIFHLDKFLWDAGWILRPKQDFLNDQRRFLNLEAWVIEGTSRTSLELRYPRSDLVIYLNPSRLLCLYRVFKRFLFAYGQTSNTPEGCPERITWAFLHYLWYFEKPASLKIKILKEKYPSTRLIEIHCKKDLIKLENEFMAGKNMFPNSLRSEKKK